MHTRSAMSKITGKFTATVIDWNGIEFWKAEFDTAHEADRAAEHQERVMTLRMQTPDAPKSLDEIFMSDDELLRELEA